MQQMKQSDLSVGTDKLFSFSGALKSQRYLPRETLFDINSSQTTEEVLDDNLHEEDRTTNTILAQSHKYIGKESGFAPLINEDGEEKNLLQTQMPQ